MGANMSRKKIIMAVVGAIALAIASAVGLVVKNKFTGGKTGKNTISYSRLGINKKSANVDQLIARLRAARGNGSEMRPGGAFDLRRQA